MAETGLSFAEIFTVFFYYYSLSLSTLIVFIKSFFHRGDVSEKSQGHAWNPNSMMRDLVIEGLSILS